MMKVKLFKIRIAENHLIQDQNRLDEFMKNNEILKVETSFVQEKEMYWSVILMYETMHDSVVEEKDLYYDEIEEEVLSEADLKLLDSLKLWRSDKAKEQNLPTYFIASNKVLISVVKSKPCKKEELNAIKGFGRHKIENYGHEIIQILSGIKSQKNKTY